MMADKAFDDFVSWRSYIIRALINEDKLFRKTIVVDLDRSIKLWEVELDDGLLALLPPSTTPLNFTSSEISDQEWLHRMSLYCGAWLASIALNSDGLHKDDRELLFKEINKLPAICDVCSAVGERIEKAKYPQAGDADAECYDCPNHASCVFWSWCGTCKEDIYRGYCNSCDMNRDDNCLSCSCDFTMVVRCSENFDFCYLH